MLERMLADIRLPGSEFRGKPFWAWNGKLDPEELRRQIRAMKAMGLGGFFMHARVGLDTAYLSADWFDCVGACIDEAEKLGMEAWLYDEDRWPSGQAGGFVTKNPAHRARMIRLEAVDPERFAWDADTLAAYAAEFDGGALARYARLPKGGKPAIAKGGRLLALRRVIHPSEPWFNGQACVDVLNPAAVKAFLRATHEAYAKRFGRKFGKSVPGVFTDEVAHMGYDLHPVDSPPGRKNSAPWTEALPRAYRKRFGLDVFDALPEVFFDVKGRADRAARWRYHEITTALFASSFTGQIGEWCGRRGLLLTGHFNEDDLTTQTILAGSVLRHYEHMQAPGLDLLTEHWRTFDAAKQVSSAARQFGRRTRLTETYGCT